MSTAARVNSIFIDCLFRPEELPDEKGKAPDNAVLVQGIVQNFGFHPQRLESHRDEIREILELMPEKFRESSGEEGGGTSFLERSSLG